MPDARDLEADLQFNIFYFLKTAKFTGRKSGNCSKMSRRSEKWRTLLSTS
jgi:hypothetical protein